MRATVLRLCVILKNWNLARLGAERREKVMGLGGEHAHRSLKLRARRWDHSRWRSPSPRIR